MFGLYCRLNENNIILACVIPERLETIVSRILRWWLCRSNYSSILAILEKLLKRQQHVSYGYQLILHQPDRPHQPTTQSTSDYRNFASEHTMHRWMHTYIASRRNTQQSVSTAPTVMRPLNISCSTAHCTTTSDPDYCQLNQIYTTRYMDPLHNCNEQPPTTCQPWTDVTRLSEVWGTKKGKR